MKKTRVYQLIKALYKELKINFHMPENIEVINYKDDEILIMFFFVNYKAIIHK